VRWRAGSKNEAWPGGAYPVRVRSSTVVSRLARRLAASTAVAAAAAPSLLYTRLHTHARTSVEGSLLGRPFVVSLCPRNLIWFRCRVWYYYYIYLLIHLLKIFYHTHPRASVTHSMCGIIIILKIWCAS